MIAHRDRRIAENTENTDVWNHPRQAHKVTAIN